MKGRVNGGGIIKIMLKKLLTVSAVFSLVACGQEPQPVQPAVDLEAGRHFAEEHCTGCHTLEGAGKSSEIPNLAGQPAAYLTDAMREITRSGFGVERSEFDPDIDSMGERRIGTE